MRAGLIGFWLFASATGATPAHTNMLVPMTYEQKIERSDIVVIGVVTAVTRTHSGRHDRTATVAPIVFLKGDQPDEIVVLASSRIAEADPHCCTIGATYLMFLNRVPGSPVLASVNGAYGMVKIGASREEATVHVLPAQE